jgi:hypothetical protein
MAIGVYVHDYKARYLYIIVPTYKMCHASVPLICTHSHVPLTKLRAGYLYTMHVLTRRLISWTLTVQN